MTHTHGDLNEQVIIDATRKWLEKAVIGLNLCPFAKAVHIKQQIHYVVSTARTTAQLRDDLIRELHLLAETAPEKTDTTLLIHPWVLCDFLEYNDFLDVADEILAEEGFDGEMQIASFHPNYQFADAAPHDIENYTNRAPFPTLHLLREASIDRAVKAFPDAAEIFERNMETMRHLGLDGWKRLGLDNSAGNENS
jgi:uncharacterized protein